MAGLGMRAGERAEVTTTRNRDLRSREESQNRSSVSADGNLFGNCGSDRTLRFLRLMG
jgi:hypothetical protein